MKWAVYNLLFAAVQLVRREVIEGNMLAAVAKDHPGERKAIEVWARAGAGGRLRRRPFRLGRPL